MGSMENTEKIMMRQVSCEHRVLEYQLTRKSVKNINLRIKPDGRILVSANSRVPLTFLDDFVRKNQEYIIRALEKYEERRENSITAPKQYESGEYFPVLGKKLRLEVREGKEESVNTDGASIFLTVKTGNKDNLKRKEKLLNNWLKSLRWELFEQICRETYPIVERYHVPYPQLKIRCMTSRWGSCQPVKGIVTLNSRLIGAPRSCIEYVVLHEFAHFIHPNHSKAFYAFVAQYMPDWKERKKALEKNI